MKPSSTSDPWIGHLIDERQRYRIEKRIGAGGMGDVFLAMDTLLGQQVALKLLKDTLTAAGNLSKRFEREVTLCAALKSEHIVQVSDYGVTAQGHPFYVMEYLRGQTLGQLLRREKRLTVERTVGIIRQVCAGLQLAHHGVTIWRDGATVNEHIQVVHRDLKPDNIFLVPTDLGELVKILDFGIAKILDDSDEQTKLTSTFLGTFRYSAPEQLQVEQNLDGRADIYSLGIILYEMLSGSDPFGFGVKARSTSGVTWGMAHASKQPQPLRTQPGCEQLSAELEAVVMRCLQKAPGDRFQSVDELNQALQTAMAAVSSTANPLPTSSEQEIDATIAQTPSSPVQGSDDKTINRPLIPSEPRLPEVTVAQIPSLPKQGTPDATRAQIPSPPRQEVSDTTIAQVSSSTEPRLPDATIAPIRSPRLPTNLLLPLGAGIAISLTVMGAIAYFHFQHFGAILHNRHQSGTPPSPALSPTPSTPSSTPTTQPPDDCDAPNSRCL